MEKSKSPMKLRISPIKKSRRTLMMFFICIGLFLLTARGIERPMINKKEGKTMSARVKPFQR